MYKVAILGLGTIGYGVYDILNKNFKDEFKVVKVFDKDYSKNDLVGGIITNSLDDICNDKEISICVETLGGLDFAYNCIKRCMESGKSVVSANKEVVSKYFYELMNLKEKCKVDFSFEASCGGGVPIIKNLIDISKNSKIYEIHGILNGTTNYILTKLSIGYSFDDAMNEAIEKGFAERDSSYDFDGLDMLRKISILASIATGKVVNIDDVYHYSLKNVTSKDIKNASELGYTIKYIASFKNDFLYVEPRLVNDEFKDVKYEYNLIKIAASNYDTLSFYGKGAGRYPTAAAICTDLYDIYKHNLNYKHACVNEKSKENAGLKVKKDEEIYQFMVRVKDLKLVNCDIIDTKLDEDTVFTKEIGREELFKNIGGLDNVLFYASRM